RNARRSVTWDEIVDKTGLTSDEVETYGRNLIRDGLLDRADAGTGVHLTQEGVVAVEEPGHPLTQPSTSPDASGVYAAAGAPGAPGSAPLHRQAGPVTSGAPLTPVSATSARTSGGMLHWLKEALPWRKRA